MKVLAKHVLHIVLFALFLGLLVWMVIQAGPMQLWMTLCSMPGTIAGCVGIWGVGYLLNAASFREVLYAVHSPLRAAMSYWRILRLTVTGYAINYITPFGLLGGEPYRVLVLKPMTGSEKATRSVVLYSTMHVSSHFTFWALAALVAAFVLQSGNADNSPSTSVTAAITLAGVLSLFDWRYLPPSTRVKALGYEFISRMVNVLEYQVIMQAMGYTEFGYTEAFLCVAFSSLFANVLFFSPMQMGTREGGILLALQYLMPQIQQQDLLPVALGLSFATRARELIWIGIGVLLLDLKNHK